MQNRDRIQSVSVKNFGTIANLQVEGLENINLIIGENGTGKSFLLKALYAAMKTIEDYKRGEDVRTSVDILSERLRWCFQTEKLGDLVKKGSSDGLSFEMKWVDSNSAYEFSYGFTDKTTVKVPNVKNEVAPLESNSIFIPAKEVLSLYNIILKSREVDRSFGFDDTYYDLARALRIVLQN